MSVFNLFIDEDSLANNSNNDSKNVVEFIEDIQSTIGIYLYPCLIEYSLICITVFYVMWQNVGRTNDRPFAHFSDRHLFVVNCSRSSYGLLLGGIILIVSIIALIPDYVVSPSVAILITRVIDLALLLLALLTVCTAFFHTMKLPYGQEVHADVFNQILILVTTVGDFAYSFLGLFASIFLKPYTSKVPRAVAIILRLVSILQTFVQSSFILDTLKRRVVTRNEIRHKPGRQHVTTLLLTNFGK